MSESALDSFKLEYEQMPFRLTRYSGGKDSKMSKQKTTNEVAPKVYAKTRGEHFKDIVIAILVASIIAFIGGMQFAKGNQAEIDRAVSAVQPTAQVSAEAKK